ncbi:MAG: alpha/beta hydrolase family protein [Dysgonomonas sp.]|jgi:pimeloyl-ACP methyl ester carboxylesterase|uniref:alpha/beta hydrolase family protein n=1 Tax=unclassified Dysgonomonas TaxID=2630389 RepID=UPI0025BB3B9C|nr:MULTISPECIES: alpha/beta fold hydrolase [unclassified Dysgonomonas]MDR2003260.1 lysophospholipase [Prevotella sp.]HMM03027.1 alpha/beta fold hydrolase [Dysgonomonas sp.]
MTKKDCIISYIKSVDRLINIAVFYRGCLFALLLLVSLNQVKAQSPDVTAEDIRFESAGVTLAGTIYTPRHSHAAVVLVHGSGQAPRMREFASLLAEKGISVLTYDKRGVGESEGIYAGPEVGTNNVDSANLTLLAKDASTALNVLHQLDKNIPIGLVGISQAGWIIPIAANNNPIVDFMVLFSGAVIPTLDQLIFQHYTEGKPDFWDSHTDADVRKYIPEARERISNEPDRYQLDQFVSTDPCDVLSKLSIPGLWLFGDKDVQVPVRLSMDSLNSLKAQGRYYDYCLFSTLGHNTAFSDSTEPVDIAVHWIKDRKHSGCQYP